MQITYYGHSCFEIVVKLSGEGIRHFIRDRFNWFDGAVVVISAIDITIEYTLRSINCNNKNMNYLLLTFFFIETSN